MIRDAIAEAGPHWRRQFAACLLTLAAIFAFGLAILFAGSGAVRPL